MNTISNPRTLTGLLLLLCMMFTAAPLLAEGSEGVVNVNEADADQLSLLPRVGPALAGRILEFREENGPFEEISDLLLVRGIGERTLELLRPFVTLKGATTLEEKVRVSRISQVAEEDGR